MFLIETKRGTLIVSPSLQLLRSIGEKLGIQKGPFKIEKVVNFVCYLKEIA